MWILIFIFDIWFMVCCLYATFGCESQKFTAVVVSKQQAVSRLQSTEAQRPTKTTQIKLLCVAL